MKRSLYLAREPWALAFAILRRVGWRNMLLLAAVLAGALAMQAIPPEWRGNHAGKPTALPWLRNTQ